MLVRGCQALSAADLALTITDNASGRGAVARAEIGGKTGQAGSGGVAGGGAGGVAFLSGGAEGNITAALRKLHELGPSMAGRCVVGNGE